MNILKKGIILNYMVTGSKETDKQEGELILQLNSVDIDKISVPEKTLVRFNKLPFFS